MPKILHFADAHIDMSNYGRHDPQSGLPMRVMDFLKSLDTIIDTAIDEKVDLVLFAGDAYKDRTPSPTYQREWGKRIMRLSRAGIPTLLLVGNHDLSPALGRAHALDSFETLDVPHVHVLDKPVRLGPDDLEGLELQVLALPWISRSGLMAHLDLQTSDRKEIYEQIESRLSELVDTWLEEADPNSPIILTAHASVQGAKFGGERTIMLGSDLVLPGSFVRNPKFDYVALGHIHKPQDLNEGTHPPVIYPGSIERVDFGEVTDDKYFVIANISRGKTEVEWRKLTGIRPFVDRYLRLEEQQDITQQVISILPPADELEGAIVRLVLEYPRDWESLVDDATIREYTASAFEFRLVKHPESETRIRLPEDKSVGSLSSLELLEIYWRANHMDEEDILQLTQLADEILHEA